MKVRVKRRLIFRGDSGRLDSLGRAREGVRVYEPGEVIEADATTAQASPRAFETQPSAVSLQPPAKKS